MKKGERMSDELKKKISEAQKGIARPYTTGKNHFMFGKKPSAKALIGMSKTFIKKGQRLSPQTEFKKDQKPWNKGKKFPELNGNKNPFYGKKHTQESLKKMGEAQVGRVGENAARWKGGWHKSQRRIHDMNARGSFTKKDWIFLKGKYGFMCLCCKKCEPEIKLTADHVIPIVSWSAWISNHPEIMYKCGDIENIQPLCGSCNLRKFTKVIDYRILNV